ncbi:hypothetical protein ACIFUY_06325 [Streptomyces sp. CACIS-1.16CA]|uniref:hypothetical protein n=1 Tax=Streptomyces sp. CACIS-1.16CA TaxID=1175510 RepID=UPI0037D5676D
MSRTYRVLCLSHDPAIVIERDWHRPEGAEEAVAAGIDGHPLCDLIIGAFSYPLVEVGCPASRHQPTKLPCCHGGTSWVDRDWLRVLAAGYQTTDPLVEAAVKKAYTTCWPWDRLLRLRDELDFQLREAS